MPTEYKFTGKIYAAEQDEYPMPPKEINWIYKATRSLYGVDVSIKLSWWKRLKNWMRARFIKK